MYPSVSVSRAISGTRGSATAGSGRLEREDRRRPRVQHRERADRERLAAGGAELDGRPLVVEDRDLVEPPLVGEALFRAGARDDEQLGLLLRRRLERLVHADLDGAGLERDLEGVREVHLRPPRASSRATASAGRPG